MQFYIKDKTDKWHSTGYCGCLEVPTASINLETHAGNSMVSSKCKTACWEALAFPSAFLLHKWNTELTRQKKQAGESELSEYKFDEKNKVTTEHRLISKIVVEYEI